MGELEEQIRQVLNDPGQMAELSRLARSLLGGEAEGSSEVPPEPDAGLPDLSALLGNGPGESARAEGLLRAMEPWLSPKRREKLRRARRLGRLGRLAGFALGEARGDG